jgi:hypothetical protein
MRKIRIPLNTAALLGGVLALAVGLAGQALQHTVSVLNIEIPVRVFKGDQFIDTLTLQDFQVFDNGVPQTVEAVYLVKKADIQREEGAKSGRPQTIRQFVLFFEMTEYVPELETALNLFFANVFLPGDNLIVVTPARSYNIREGALARMPREKIKEQLLGHLRADILIGNTEYHNIIRDLRNILAGDELPIEEKLDYFSVAVNNLEGLRRVDEKSLVKFADFLKGLTGQKYIYLFYQKERIPEYDWKQLMMMMAEYNGDPAMTLKLMDNFQMAVRNVTFNVEAVKKAYSDSSVAVHFLFITKTPKADTDVENASASGLKMVEHSEDIYSAFSEIAAATGGISDSSANAAASFQKAVVASENYYLLYYKPKDYKPDGSFHELKVVVTSGSYLVTHRAGYVAK